VTPPHISNPIINYNANITITSGSSTSINMDLPSQIANSGEDIWYIGLLIVSVGSVINDNNSIPVGLGYITATYNVAYRINNSGDAVINTIFTVAGTNMAITPTISAPNRVVLTVNNTSGSTASVSNPMIFTFQLSFSGSQPRHNVTFS
jgi:hypothetical protein